MDRQQVDNEIFEESMKNGYCKRQVFWRLCYYSMLRLTKDEAKIDSLAIVRMISDNFNFSNKFHCSINACREKTSYFEKVEVAFDLRHKNQVVDFLASRSTWNENWEEIVCVVPMVETIKLLASDASTIYNICDANICNGA